MRGLMLSKKTDDDGREVSNILFERMDGGYVIASIETITFMPTTEKSRYSHVKKSSMRILNIVDLPFEEISISKDFSEHLERGVLRLGQEVIHSEAFYKTEVEIRQSRAKQREVLMAAA